jgi:hypothetical protein
VAWPSRRTEDLNIEKIRVFSAYRKRSSFFLCFKISSVWGYHVSSSNYLCTPTLRYTPHHLQFIFSLLLNARCDDVVLTFLIMKMMMMMMMILEQPVQRNECQCQLILTFQTMLKNYPFRASQQLSVSFKIVCIFLKPMIRSMPYKKILNL